MKSIRYNDGYKTYILNDDESNKIRINITDLNIPARYEEAKQVLDEIAEEIKSAKGEPDASQLKEYDTRIREQIDHIFGSAVSDPAFGTASCLSPVEGGKWLFQTFIEALIEVVLEDMQPALESAQNARREKIEAYTEPVADTGDKLSGMSDEEKDALLRELLK